MSDKMPWETWGCLGLTETLREPHRPFLPITARPTTELVRAELRDVLDADTPDLEWAAWAIQRELDRRRG